MSHKYKTHAGGLYFASFAVVGWIDLFTRADYADLLLDCIDYCIKHKKLQVYAYVVMPSHVHLLADVADDDLLAHLLRDLKSYSAKRLHELIEQHPQESRRDWLLYQLAYYGKRCGQDFKIWQDGSHPICLTEANRALRCRDYIHQNPVIARLVTEAQYYPFSSACPDQPLKLTDL